MDRFWRHFHRRAGEEAGTVLVVVCIAMVAMVGATALAVDVGRVADNNRTLQTRADVIALDAGRALSGQTAAQLSGASGAVVVAVQNSATRNNMPFSKLTVDLGTMSGTTFTTIATPVLNGAIQTVTSTSVPKAVRVTAGGTVNFLFDMSKPHGSKTTSRAAISTMDNYGGFSIGSWLASLSGGNNTVLGALFGDAFHLNVVSYNGLVNGNVTLQQLGLDMPGTALSPTQLLSTSVSIHDFMLASIAALNAQGNTAAVNVLNSMMANASLTGSIKLGDFMTVASGGEATAASAPVNVLQLLTAGAMVLEKNGGHALSIPTTSITLPAGIGSVTASATVLEPPQYYWGTAPGPTISTAQVRLSVNPVINTATPNGTTPCTVSLANLLGLLGCILQPILPLGVTLNGSFPVDVTAAGATGQLTSVNCATPGITVGYTTQAVNLNAAANLNLDLTLAGSSFLSAARVNVAAGAKTSPTSGSASFTYPNEFFPTTVKHVGSSGLGLNGLLNVTSANVSILVSALNTAAVSSVVSSLAVPVLNSLLGSLDTALVLPIMQVLGVQFGGADIAALAYSCNGLRLAG
jgi:uncharacterized membrane protein